MTSESTLVSHQLFMQRCLQLALLGEGHVAPNPMVGAVLVYEGQIIGEGYHKKYGEAHAEVNCLASVKEEHRDKIRTSILYVTLEPCAHFGKTPPCADLIIRNEIPTVVIGTPDPFTEVNGRGIKKLRNAGIETITGVLEAECRELNKRFFTFYTKQRPYIILKWAETENGVIAALVKPDYLNNAENTTISGFKPVAISNDFTNRMVHHWRSQEAAIMIGRGTAAADNPNLTTRHWAGNSPIRIVVDRKLALNPGLNIFDQKVPTIIFNLVKEEQQTNLHFYKLNEQGSLLQQILSVLFSMQIQSVLVEGGAALIQLFIDEQLWDECRIIRNTQLVIEDGLAAPVIDYSFRQTAKINLLNDEIIIFQPSIF